MSHTIKYARSCNPMWYFEHNYRLLSGMLEQTQLLLNGIASFELGSCQVELRVIETTPYTSLIRIQQMFADASSYLADITFDVRVYQDVQLAEVLRYQGRDRLLYKNPYPNKNMYAPDEKRQGNLLLHDWLSTASRLDYKETVVAGCE